MEEKKANLLEQLERMKEGAEDLQRQGIKYYAMHAECAVKFATEAIEVLTATDPTKEELKPGFTLRRADGTSVTVETECVSIQCIVPVEDGCEGTMYNSIKGSNSEMLALAEMQSKAQERLLKSIGNSLLAELDELLGGNRDESK